MESKITSDANCVALKSRPIRRLIRLIRSISEVIVFLVLIRFLEVPKAVTILLYIGAILSAFAAISNFFILAFDWRNYRQIKGKDN